MVTAETAAALPVLFVVLGLCVWALACVSTQLRCADAAAMAARAAARGEAPGSVSATARQVAPAGATVEVSTVGDDVVVVVRARAGPAGGVLSTLPAVVVTGRATAAREELVGAGRR